MAGAVLNPLQVSGVVLVCASLAAWWWASVSILHCIGRAGVRRSLTLALALPMWWVFLLLLCSIGLELALGYVILAAKHLAL
jgi:hypothetical protein